MPGILGNPQKITLVIFKQGSGKIMPESMNTLFNIEIFQNILYDHPYPPGSYPNIFAVVAITNKQRNL